MKHRAKSKRNKLKQAVKITPRGERDARQGSPLRRRSALDPCTCHRTSFANNTNHLHSAEMVSTRSGFDSDGPAPARKGCCKRLLREFFLTMLDLCILMIGILKAPMTMRVIVALVLRLFIYITNAVALYALSATIIHNGRPAHPLGEDQFVADLVNALLQPAQYANVLDSPVSSPRLKRSPDFPPHDLTPAELNFLKAILQEPIQGFPSLKSAKMTPSKPLTPPTESRMVSHQVTAISTAPSRPGRAIPSTTTSPASKVTSDPPTPVPGVASTTTTPVSKATSDPPTPAPAAVETTTSPVSKATSDPPVPAPGSASTVTSPVS